MSTTNIKKGRYSRKTHLINRKQLEELSSASSFDVVYNIFDSIVCDDIKITYNDMIDKINNIDWFSEIDNLNDIVLEVNEFLKTGTFSCDEYENIFQVTGVEADNRKTFFTLIGLLRETQIRIWIPYLKNFPGLRDLDNEKFVEVITSDHCFIQALFSMTPLFEWEDHGLVLKLNDRSMILPPDSLDNLVGKDISHRRIDIQNVADGQKITNFELLYVFLIKLYDNWRNIPQLKIAYDKLLSSFTRYLEDTYGNLNHLKLRNLIDYYSRAKVRTMNIQKFCSKRKNYFFHLGNNSIFLTYLQFGIRSTNKVSTDYFIEVFRQKKILNC